jgi:hypothetical protein
MAWMVLKWSIFKIVSGDPDLHPRWPPSADIVFAMFALNWMTGFRGEDF